MSTLQPKWSSRKQEPKCSHVRWRLHVATKVFTRPLTCPRCNQSGCREDRNQSVHTYADVSTLEPKWSSRRQEPKCSHVRWRVHVGANKVVVAKTGTKVVTRPLTSPPWTKVVVLKTGTKVVLDSLCEDPLTCLRREDRNQRGFVLKLEVSFAKEPYQRDCLCEDVSWCNDLSSRMISLLKIIGLFCKRALSKILQKSPIKETVYSKMYLDATTCLRGWWVSLKA